MDTVKVIFEKLLLKQDAIGVEAKLNAIPVHASQQRCKAIVLLLIEVRLQ
jgi:hypothetical protein